MGILIKVCITALVGLGMSQDVAVKQNQLREFRANLINHTRVDDTAGYRWRCTDAHVQVSAHSSMSFPHAKSPSLYASYFFPNHQDLDSPRLKDCLDVIAQYKTVPGDATIQWETGCYKITSGTCTGSICPQKWGPIVISPSALAQRLEAPIAEHCISNGFRGWWSDTDGSGIGLYLS